MNKKEFLEQLERLLWDIPEQERKEALEYYEDYFEDAGTEEEAGVIRKLGSPGKVAAMIKADLEENREDYGEYTEAGYKDERFDDRNMPERRQASEGFHENKAGNKRNETRKDKRGLSWPLIIVLLILTAPIWGGVGIGLLGAVLGVLGACIGVVAALLFGGLGMLIGGIITFIYAMVCLLHSPAAALVATGAALIMIAAGLLFIVGFFWLAFKLFPKCFRWFVDLAQRVLHRGNAGGEGR